MIEILVVAALIVILVGGSAVAFRQNSSAALRSAEQIVAGLVRQARALATASQNATRLAVAQDEAQSFRLLQVLRLGPEGTRDPVGPVVYLPRGVAVVPPPGVSTAATWAAYSAERSLLAVQDGGEPGGELAGASGFLYLQFEPNGDLAAPTADGATVVLVAFTASAGAAVVATSDLRILRISGRGSVASSP